MQRAGKRSDPDRFESEQAEFFERVREAYRARAARYPRFAVIDAGRPLEAVTADVRQVVAAFVSGSER